MDFSNKYKNIKVTSIKMQFIKEQHKNFNRSAYKSFILGGDIGGTNCNLGIFGVKSKSSELLVFFHFNSKDLNNLYSPINEALNCIKKNYGVKIIKACLGIAGAVSHKRDYVHLTNAKLDISTIELKKKTPLKKIMLVNDFEAVGYGINVLTKNDVKTIKKAEKIPKAPVVVIGAGTGLGKATLLYNEDKGMYVPVPSESHDSDFPAQNEIQLQLVNFIKRYRKIKVVSNGDILSGEGLENIYHFLRRKFKETKFTKEIDKAKNKPELISKYRKVDKTCKAAFEIFKMAYARFAKNMALDGLALGGVYIAGGIAPKNKEIFDKEFIKIFEESHKMMHILKKIPIYLIINRDAGLLGAGFAGSRLLQK